MRSAFILAALAVVLGSAAAAQDGSESSGPRTIESAQKFLHQFYSRVSASSWFGVNAAGGEWVPTESGPPPPGYKIAFLEGDILEVRTLDRCRSEVVAKRLRTKGALTREPSVPLREPDGGVIRTIDWSTVRKIRVTPDTTSIEARPTGLTTIWAEQKNSWIAFNHGDEADANRAAFAMDFLREACGPKNDTGF